MTGIFVLSIVLSVTGILLWANRPALKSSSELRSDFEHKYESLLLWTKNKAWSMSLITTFTVAALASTFVVFKSTDLFERQFGLIFCLMDWILLLPFVGSMIFWNLRARKKNG